MSKQNPVAVGLIGCGNISSIYLQNAQTLDPIEIVACADLRREALRSGLIPIVNAMAAAGLVSLPGMMTGQILAGSPPLEAAKYQLFILFLISAGTGLGAMAAVWIGSRRLFDDRQRLRLDRLTTNRR